MIYNSGLVSEHRCRNYKHQNYPWTGLFTSLNPNIKPCRVVFFDSRACVLTHIQGIALLSIGGARPRTNHRFMRLCRTWTHSCPTVRTCAGKYLCLAFSFRDARQGRRQTRREGGGDSLEARADSMIFLVEKWARNELT